MESQNVHSFIKDIAQLPSMSFHLGAGLVKTITSAKNGELFFMFA